MYVLECTWITQNPIRLQNISLAAFCTFAGLLEWLILLEVHLPLNLVLASFAEIVEWSIFVALGKFTLIIELELCLILVFLALFFLIRH